MTSRKVKLGWYRAHFSTGMLEFQARHIGHAHEVIKTLGPEHFPGEKCYSIGTLVVRTRKSGTTKRVSKSSREKEVSA